MLPPLPLREEIASLRAQSTRASKAQVHLLRVQAERQALSVVATQRAARPDLTFAIPDGTLIDEIAQHWGFTVAPGDDLPTRRAALRYLEDALAPHVAGAGAAYARLLELIEEQKKILAEPQYHEVVHTLKHLGEALAARDAELKPVMQHEAVLGPAIGKVADMLDTLDAALMDGDPHAVERARRLASGMLASLGAVLEPFDLDGALPEPPEATEPRAAAEALRDGLERAGIALADAHAAIRERLQVVAAATETLQSEMYAITG